MPRKARVDAPGALQHIIARGIERRKVFQTKADYTDFLKRLGKILDETGTPCFAWALIPNHFHLLLKTGHAPIAHVMLRLLTGYAVCFNRRHRRRGHLFQNRYKSILCQEDAYLMELVRYIHLNPLRAKLILDMKDLDKYPYSGHSVVMGKYSNDWQDTAAVLRLFADEVSLARRHYRVFVQKGIGQGRRDDLIGGGLVRSSGGWASVKALRKEKIYQKADERILGDGDFVKEVLAVAQERLERKYALAAKGVSIDHVAERVALLMNMDTSELFKPGKEKRRVQARSVLCYWAARELDISMAELCRRFKLSASAVSLSVQRGEKIIQEKNYSLIDRN
jgi:REP element-mobilizing transposase RayT